MAIDSAQKRAAVLELADVGAALYRPGTLDTKLERAQQAFAYDPADLGGGGGGGVPPVFAADVVRRPRPGLAGRRHRIL